MEDVRLLKRCNEEFAKKTRQRNSYSEGTVTALATVLLDPISGSNPATH